MKACLKHIGTLLTVSGVLLFTPIKAQNTSTIRGYVKDAKTSAPLSDVEVLIKDYNMGTITNSKGFYELGSVGAGFKTVQYIHLGFETRTLKINFKPGEKIIKNVFLSPTTQTLAEIEIRDRTIEKKPIMIETVSKLKIQQSAARDIGDFLRNTPNLSGIRKGGAAIDPVVRGFKYKQINTIINGNIKIEGGCPNRMDPAVSHIDINDLEKMEVYKGPFALRFGPMFGGVINLKTIRPDFGKEFSTKITAIKGFESNWNGNKEHLSISAGNKNACIMLSGNHKKYGNYEAGNGEVINSQFTRYNYTAQIGVSPAKDHELHFSYDRSYGRNVSYPALPMDERSDDTHLYSFNYQLTNISKSIQHIKLKSYFSDVHHIMDNKERPFSDTVVAVSDIRAKNSGGRLESLIKWGNSTIIFGIDYEHITKDGTRTKNMILQPNLPVKKEMLWNNASIKNTGVFALLTKKTGLWDLNFSARIDLNTATSGNLQLKNMSGNILYENDQVDSELINFSMSTGAFYNFTKNTGMGLSLGRGIRSPDMTERFIILLPIGYDNYDYLGNPKLKPEVNYEADIKFEHKAHTFGYFEAGIFLSYVKDYITGTEVPPSEVKPQSKDVVGVKEFYNADHVYLYGFEAKYASPADYKFGITAVAAATFGVNPGAIQYIVKDKQVVDEQIVKNDPLPEIPPFESSLTINYKFFDNRLKPEFSVRMTARQASISEAFYENETPGFITANFKVNYIFNEMLSVNGGVNNIFNKAYYEHLNRRIIGSNLPLYEPGRMFFINLIFKM